MKKKSIIIIVFIVFNIFLSCVILFENKKIEKLNKSISEKEKLIIDNNSKISALQTSIADAEMKTANLEKEYEVWIHQNQLLENILQ